MKIWNYIVMIVVLEIVLELAGIPIASNILNYVGIDIATGASIKSSLLYLGIFGVGGILVGVVGGIVIGYFTKSSPENFIILPFIVGGGVLFGATLTGIITYAYANYSSWVAHLILVIIAPLAVGFFIGLVEFFRGTD